MDSLVDFLAVHGNFFRSDNAQANLVAADFDDRHCDIVVYHNALIPLP